MAISFRLNCIFYLFMMQSFLFRSGASFGPATRFRMATLHVLREPAAYSTLNLSSDDMVLDPLIVCGPSGVGKGTIIEKYMNEMGGKERFQFTVSHTTRSPRPGETDGIHYHFVEMETMKRAIDHGEFLEHAEVHGNYYGTSWKSLRDVQTNGKRCLLDIDVQGVKNIKRMESETLKPKYVFISPPSLKVLQERLVGRGTESPESISRRSANAQRELEYGMHEGNFDFIVVNYDLYDACQEFASVVQELYGL